MIPLSDGSRDILAEQERDARECEEGRRKATGHTPGPLTFSPQKGTIGHCFMAQVWGPDGKSVACIDDTADPAVATAYAQLFASAPDMLAACEELLEIVSDIRGPAAAMARKMGQDAIQKAKGTNQ